MNYSEQVEEWFTRLRSLPAGERGAALARLAEPLRADLTELLQADETPVAARLEETEFQARYLGAFHHLLAGLELGGYRLEEQLAGAGLGMVFRASDPLTGEVVAMKLLPPEHMADSGWRTRFQREAAALRALEHPGIVRLRESGDDRGFFWFTMDLVEGETLRARLNHASPSQAEAAGWIEQIADALAAAHASGFLHNDLKPENIMVNREGRIVLLDFGLTRPLMANTPVTQATVTTVSGTVRYLSPERVAGETPDERSDVFALGILLFELLTGKTPFERPNPLATAAAILHEPAPGLPPGPYADLVRRCLEKGREKRPPSVLEFRRMLLAANGTSETHSARRPRWAWLAAACAALLAVSGYTIWRQTAPALDDSIRLEPSLSADGRTLIYVSNRDERSRLDLYLSADRGRAMRLTNTLEDEREPEVSPDGREILYRLDGPRDFGIYASPIDGRRERRRIAPEGHRPRWSPDGQWILFSSRPTNDPDLYNRAVILVASADGSVGPTAVSTDSPVARFPIWLDRESLLFLDARDGQTTRLERLRLDLKRGRAPVPAGIEEVNQGAFGYMRPLICLPNGGVLAKGPSDAELIELSLNGAQTRTFPLAGVDSVTSDRSGNLVIASAQRAVSFHRWKLSGGGLEPVRGLPPETSRVWATAGGNLWTREPGRLVKRTLFEPHREISLMSMASDSHSVLNRAGTHASLRNPADPVWGQNCVLMELSTKKTVAFGARSIVWDVSPGGRYVLYPSPEPFFRMLAAEPAANRSWVAFEDPDYNLYLGAYSADGRWATFVAEAPGKTPHHWVAPVRPGKPTPFSEWIEMPPGGYGQFSEDGAMLYFLSDSDGQRCLYRQKLDPVTKRPLGPAELLHHFHDHSASLRLNAFGQFRMSAGRDALYLPVLEWRTDLHFLPARR